MSQVQGQNFNFGNVLAATSKALDFHLDVQNQADKFHSEVALVILQSVTAHHQFINAETMTAGEATHLVDSLKVRVEDLTTKLKTLYSNFSKALEFIQQAERASIKTLEALTFLHNQKNFDDELQIQNLEIITKTTYPLLKNTVEYEMVELKNQVADLESVLINFSASLSNAYSVDAVCAKRLTKTDQKISAKSHKHNQSTLSSFNRALKSEVRSSNSVEQLNAAEKFAYDQKLAKFIEQRQLALRDVRSQLQKISKEPSNSVETAQAPVQGPIYTGPIIEEIEEPIKPTFSNASKALAITFPKQESIIEEKKPVVIEQKEEKAPVFVDIKPEVKEDTPTIIFEESVQRKPTTEKTVKTRSSIDLDTKSTMTLRSRSKSPKAKPQAANKNSKKKTPRKPRALAGLDSSNILDSSVKRTRKTRSK